MQQIVPIDLSLGINNDFYGSPAFTMQVWLHQFLVLFERCFKQYLRRTDVLIFNLISTVLMAIFVSCGIWYQIGNGQASIATRVPSLFFACVLQVLF